MVLLVVLKKNGRSVAIVMARDVKMVIQQIMGNIVHTDIAVIVRKKEESINLNL
jgi:hypothetical protein